MVNVMTMEEREAGKKKRGFAKFKEDAKRVGKKVGKVVKKGIKVATGVAGVALRDPTIREFAKDKVKEGLHWLAGHPLADELSYGKVKKLKPWVDTVVDASDIYMGPEYFGPQTSFAYSRPRPSSIGKDGYVVVPRPGTVSSPKSMSKTPPSSPRPGKKPRPVLSPLVIGKSPTSVRFSPVTPGSSPKTSRSSPKTPVIPASIPGGWLD